MAIVTCVTCEQVLMGGQCTNELCPGYTPSEASLQDTIAYLNDAALQSDQRIAALETALANIAGAAAARSADASVPEDVRKTFTWIDEHTRAALSPEGQG